MKKRMKSNSMEFSEGQEEIILEDYEYEAEEMANEDT